MEEERLSGDPAGQHPAELPPEETPARAEEVDREKLVTETGQGPDLGAITHPDQGVIIPPELTDDVAEVNAEGPDVEADFISDYGTTDIIRATEEGETYFPPTDPVVLPSTENPGGLEVVGGWAPTSLDEPRQPHHDPNRIEYSDDEISDHVKYALRADAGTTDLAIDVATVNRVVYLRGQVRSLEDTDLAAAVAEQVEGVLEVVDQLEIEGF